MSNAAGLPIVVCVDDEPGVLAALQRLLRKESYQLLTTESPEVALGWILEKKASLVIADQRMPSMPGLDLLELVRACSPATIRVMLSGQSDLSEILTRKRIEAIEWMLRKPWDPDGLKLVLRGLLTRRPSAPELETPGV